MKSLLHYWGFLALAAAIIGWVTHTLTWVLILIFAAGALAYFLVQAPVWCGAMTREGQMCRNNSTGLLLGWTAPGILEALIPGRMQSHACTAEVPR